MNIIKRIAISIASVLPISSLSFGSTNVDLTNENLDNKESLELRGMRVRNSESRQVIKDWQMQVSLNEALMNFVDSNPSMSDDNVIENFDALIGSLEEKGIITIKEDIIASVSGSSFIPPE